MGTMLRIEDLTGKAILITGASSGTLSGYVTGQNIHVNGGQAMP
jgi:NAD(P)-dependent dehydrogenase (short-subunit alcohol dehydrogenase family)